MRVAVLMGGRSSEHEISLASAQSVLEALDPGRYEVVTIEIDREGRWALESGRTARQLPGEPPGSPGTPSSGPLRGQATSSPGAVPETNDPQLPVPAASNEVAATLGEVEVVLPILHGPFGEDGTVQGLLELAGVAYVGAGVAASALCMDKDLFKAVMRDQGIPVTRNITLRAGSVAGKAGDARREPLGAGSVAGKAGNARPEPLGNAAVSENPFGYPVFVKPARLGSSVGITKAHDEQELRAGVALAFEHDEKVLVEEFVAGVEVEVGVLGNREPFASLVGEIAVTHNEWYDYEAKYDEGEMDLIIPAGIAEEQAARVQELAVQAFVATECEGMARVDCFVRDDGDVLVNELNTIPGFTSTSVYARLFEASGIPYPDLLQRLVELALERHERRSKLKF